MAAIMIFVNGINCENLSCNKRGVHIWGEENKINWLYSLHPNLLPQGRRSIHLCRYLCCAERRFIWRYSCSLAILNMRVVLFLFLAFYTLHQALTLLYLPFGQLLFLTMKGIDWRLKLKAYRCPRQLQLVTEIIH